MSWRSGILVVEARGPGENHRPVASNGQTLSHIVVDPTTIPSRPRRPLPWMCIKHLNIIQVYYLKHTYHHFKEIVHAQVKYKVNELSNLPCVKSLLTAVNLAAYLQ